MDSELTDKLDEIEAELRRIGYWSENPPDLQAQYAGGSARSYLDAPTFELWLQTIFLPHARQAVATASLPTDSHVGTMALRQYDYHSSVPEAHSLVELLLEFDEMVRNKTR
ncbi:MAG: hypothetical protein HDKAJFGB_00161 [Anaerolineae bacterium]|nr:hypothetical protein [Anaerolineae bacterium]